MTFDEFQAFARPMITPNANELTFWATGLGGEIGEVIEELMDVASLSAASARLLNVCKKVDRDGSSPELDARIEMESGDVLFYLNQILVRRRLSLESAAQACVAKLQNMRTELQL